MHTGRSWPGSALEERSPLSLAVASVTDIY